MFTVLGADGFIGRKLVRDLALAGHEVYALARNETLDLKRPLGHAIYAIGLTADFRTRPFDTVRAHVSLLADILETSLFDSFLYLSSTRIYGSGSDTSEESPLAVRPEDPSDLYNLSKLMGESLCLQSGRPGARVARLSNVIGPGATNAKTFFAVLCREAASGNIHLQTALTSAKDYIWIDDVVGLLPRIAMDGQERIYNVASGRQVSHGDWTDAISRLTGCGVSIAKDAPEISFPPIAIKKIEREFDFHSSPPLEMLPNILSAKIT